MTTHKVVPLEAVLNFVQAIATDAKGMRCEYAESRSGHMVQIPDFHSLAAPAPSGEAVDRHKTAFDEWIAKTDFVQEWISSGRLSAKYLGWHRADILRDLVENPPAAERDAEEGERYRFLKEHHTQIVKNDPDLGTMVNLSFMRPDIADLDAAIDAARKGEGA